MGNLGGGEILVILLVALIVLGPTKLPPAIRQVGKFMGEIRRVGQGFQEELREAAKPLQEATADFKAADKSLRETTQKPLKEMTDTLKAADPRKVIEPPPDTRGKDGDAAKGKDASRKGNAAAGPVSWGTAAAGVSAPPAAGDVSEAAASGADVSEAAASGADVSEAAEPAADVSEAAEPAADVSEAAASGADVSEAAASGADVSEAAASGADVSEAAEPATDVSEAEKPDPASQADDTT